jgi:hypothetical protein
MAIGSAPPKVVLRSCRPRAASDPSRSGGVNSNRTHTPESIGTQRSTSANQTGVSELQRPQERSPKRGHDITALVVKRNGMVILLDFLGTSSLPPETDWAEVLARRVRLLEMVREIKLSHRGTIRLADPANPSSPVVFVNLEMKPNVVAFSDTMMFTIASENDPLDLLQSVAGELSRIFVQAVSEGELLRGVIATGEFFEEGPITVGPWAAAVKTHLEKPKWAGIVIEPVSSRVLYPLPESWFGYVRWQVPTKSGPTVYYSLSWPSAIVGEEASEPTLRSRLNVLFDRGAGRADVELKRRSTLEFLDNLQPWVKANLKNNEDLIMLEAEVQANLSTHGLNSEDYALRFRQAYEEEARKRGLSLSTIPRSPQAPPNDQKHEG